MVFLHEMLLWPWHLTYWPQNVQGSSTGPIFLPSRMTVTQTFQDIEQDGFALNATVTLTFDLVTSKWIGVIYWPWPIFLPSRMTVTYKLLKILSRQGFCIKCYCDFDLWPTNLKMYRVHLLTMTNLPTKYHDCHS